MLGVANAIVFFIACYGSDDGQDVRRTKEKHAPAGSHGRAISAKTGRKARKHPNKFGLSVEQVGQGVADRNDPVRPL